MADDLARALVALPGWRWMPGMRAVYPNREHYGEARLSWTVGDEGEQVEYMGHDYAGSFPTWGWPSPESGWLPDLTDDATGGCLLAMLEFAGAEPNWCTDEQGRYINIKTSWGRGVYEGPSLGEACARALLSLWGYDAGRSEP